MGMTDKQFKDHMRGFLTMLEKALSKSPDNEEIKELIMRCKFAIED